MQFLQFLLYLLLTILGLGILIFVHELGHYLTARACHVTIHEFSLGMGKRIAGFRSEKTGIEYNLRLFPIGGFVAMEGEDIADESEEGTSDPNAFCKKNVWQRILILVSGAGMNILVGFLAMIILTVGMFAGGQKMPSTTIGAFTETAMSDITGLKLNDTVLKVDGVRVHTGYDLSYEIMNAGYEPVDVLVLRDGQKVLVKDVCFPSFTSEGITLGDMDFRVYGLEGTFGDVWKVSFWRSVSSIKMVFDSLGGLISGRYSLSTLSGPIGVTSAVQDVAAQPMAGWNLLYLFSLIAMNLGVMNLLPLPALDGGRLFFRVLEVICLGHAVSPKLEAKIHAVGMVVLLMLTAVIAFKDIFTLI